MNNVEKWRRKSVFIIPTATKKEIEEKYIELVTMNEELIEKCATLGRMLFELKIRSGYGNWGMVTRHLPINYQMVSNLIKLWKKRDRLKNGVTLFLRYGLKR